MKVLKRAGRMLVGGIRVLVVLGAVGYLVWIYFGVYGLAIFIVLPLAVLVGVVLG